jgi:hypothetical protein
MSGKKDCFIRQYSHLFEGETVNENDCGIIEKRILSESSIAVIRQSLL